MNSGRTKVGTGSLAILSGLICFTPPAEASPPKQAYFQVVDSFTDGQTHLPQKAWWSNNDQPIELAFDYDGGVWTPDIAKRCSSSPNPCSGFSTANFQDVIQKVWRVRDSNGSFTGRITVCGFKDRVSKYSDERFRWSWVYDIKDGHILYAIKTGSTEPAKSAVVDSIFNPVGQPLWSLTDTELFALEATCESGDVSATDAPSGTGGTTPSPSDNIAADLNHNTNKADNLVVSGDLRPITNPSSVSAGQNQFGIIKGLRATSTLKSQSTSSYTVTNLGDRNPATAWVEGAPDAGLGQAISFRTDRVCNGLTIMNGYQKSDSSFANNSRIKSLRVTVGGTAAGTLQLEDRAGEQHFALALPANVDVTLTLTDTYAGAKWQDTALSELWQTCP